MLITTAEPDRRALVPAPTARPRGPPPATCAGHRHRPADGVEGQAERPRARLSAIGRPARASRPPAQGLAQEPRCRRHRRRGRARRRRLRNCSTSRPATARSSPASSARSVPTRSSARPACCRASARAHSARVRSTIRRMNRSCGPFDVVVMSFGTFCADDDPGLLGNVDAPAARRRRRCCRGRQPAVEPPVLPGGAAGRHRRRRAGPRRTGVVHQLRQLGRRLCAGGRTSSARSSTTSPRRSTGKPRRRFREWARWSGTSFAAPKVAGAIAQEMYVSQVDAHEAWRRLSSTAHLRLPDLGVVVNV